MKRILWIGLLSVCIVFLAKAQQDPLYAQYMNNPLVINPAYAGLNNNFNAGLLYRIQWTGFEEHPSTMNFNCNVSILDNKVGAGVVVIQDKLGSVLKTEFQTVFSYKLHLDTKTFSFGMQAGFINFKNNFSNLKLDDPGDPAFIQNENVIKPSIGAGAILKNDQYFMGISVPRLIKTKINMRGQDFQLYNQHYYMFGAYAFHLTQQLQAKPSLLVKYVKGAPLSFDANVNIVIDASYSIGAFTRNFNTHGMQLQTKFSNKYKFGYIVEIPTNSSVGSRFMTHEFYIGFILPVLNFHERYAIINW
jgi:type IX secretion system PorP/SprF family membrane protein